MSCCFARLPVDLRFICFLDSVWSSFYIVVTFCNIALVPLFSLPSTSIVTHPTPCTQACFSPLFFVVVFMLILPDVDLTLFITFITTCKTSSINVWFVLAAGLAESLTQVVFRQPFVIQHVRTRLLSCETWNFLFFFYFSSPYNQLVIVDVIVFPLAAFVLFRDLSRKNAWLKPYHKL